jgi:methoxymalonate biosynthesis acyl carrier protein
MSEVLVLTEQQITERIGTFLTRSFEGRTLGEDDDIFALGFGNSLFAMQLVSFLEKEFHLEIESEDLEMENFKTLRAMVLLVKKKTGA